MTAEEARNAAAMGLKVKFFSSAKLKPYVGTVKQKNSGLWFRGKNGTEKIRILVKPEQLSA